MLMTLVTTILTFTLLVTGPALAGKKVQHAITPQLPGGKIIYGWEILCEKNFLFPQTKECTVWKDAIAIIIVGEYVRVTVITGHEANLLAGTSLQLDEQPATGMYVEGDAALQLIANMLTAKIARVRYYRASDMHSMEEIISLSGLNEALEAMRQWRSS
jgi:hypothetical protein